MIFAWPDEKRIMDGAVGRGIDSPRIRAVLQFTWSHQGRARWLFLEEKATLRSVLSLYTNWRAAIGFAYLHPMANKGLEAMRGRGQLSLR